MTQQIQKGEHSSWWSNIGSAHVCVPENEIISPGVMRKLWVAMANDCRDSRRRKGLLQLVWEISRSLAAFFYLSPSYSQQTMGPTQSLGSEVRISVVDFSLI